MVYSTPQILTSYYAPDLYAAASGFASTTLDNCNPGDDNTYDRVCT